MRRINVLLLDEADQFVREFQQANGIRSLDETLNALFELYGAAGVTEVDFEKVAKQLKEGELLNETDSLGLS